MFSLVAAMGNHLCTLYKESMAINTKPPTGGKRKPRKKACPLPNPAPHHPPPRLRKASSRRNGASLNTPASHRFIQEIIGLVKRPIQKSQQYFANSLPPTTPQRHTEK